MEISLQIGERRERPKVSFETCTSRTDDVLVFARPFRVEDVRVHLGARTARSRASSVSTGDGVDRPVAALARASPSRPRARGKGGRSTGTGRSGERGVAALLLLGVTALAISGLTSTYVPRLVLWRQGASCVPGDVEPCPPEAHHPDIDVVSVAVKPTCVTRVAIASINQYVAPRFIRFVSADADACATLVAMARNVRCTAQDEVIPGVTKDAVARELERLFPKDSTSFDARYLGRERAGWYLQQLIKLGVARHLPDLTSTFLVWDPDMIALEPFRVFSSERSGKTGKERVVRHVGGYAIRSYEDAYARLTGEPLASAPDGSSYVTHAMTFERAFAEELLGAFADAWEDTVRKRAEDLFQQTEQKRTSLGAETTARLEEEDETFVLSRDTSAARRRYGRRSDQDASAHAHLGARDLGFAEPRASRPGVQRVRLVRVLGRDAPPRDGRGCAAPRLDEAPARTDARQFRDPDPATMEPGAEPVLPLGVRRARDEAARVPVRGIRGGARPELRVRQARARAAYGVGDGF